MIDPGFYNWGDADDEYDQQAGAGENGSYTPDSAYAQPYPEPSQEPDNVPGAYAPYRHEPPGPVPPGTLRPSYQGPSSSGAAATEEQLTLIFKNGRAPKTIGNYIMDTKALTDVDPQNYERIPIEEIDVAATARANRPRGVDFEVPGDQLK